MIAFVVILSLVSSFVGICIYFKRNTKELTQFEFMQEAAKPCKGDMAQYYYD